MSGFSQVRDGVERAISTLAEGWQQLRDRAGRALTRFVPHAGGGALQTQAEQVAMLSPRWGVLASEVIEKDSEVVVRLEVPGMESDDFEIFVSDDALVVRGEKFVQRDDSEGKFHVIECAYGGFERVVPLPAVVDDSRATARYRRGVLRVVLPKVEAARSRRIDVATR